MSVGEVRGRMAANLQRKEARKRGREAMVTGGPEEVVVAKEEVKKKKKKGKRVKKTGI